MMKCIFSFLVLILFSHSAYSQAVIPFGEIHPKLTNTVNEQYFEFQWALVNYGHVVQQQRSELEYEPLCGKNFELSEFDRDDISAEEFFLGSSGKDCVPVESSSGATAADKKDFDISWLNYILNLDSLIKRDVVVAVVDSGLDYDHPDIIDNIARDLKKCNFVEKPGEIKRKKKRRDPKQGRGQGREESKEVPPISEFDFSADCLGWNFTDPKQKLGTNIVYDDSSISHGTHIAGILSAAVGNGIGVSGISNRIKVLPVKVFREFTRNEAQKFSVESEFKLLLDQVATGLEYLALVKRNGRHVDAVNLSFGWPKRLTTDRLNKAIQRLIDLDIAVVAAAGNDDVNVDLFPCAYPGVICVGAHSNTGEITSFSNYGSTVDMLAAGDNILSLSRTDEISQLFSQSDNYDFLSGTSQAAPFVAGAAAILKGIYKDISLDEIKARLYTASLKEEKTDHKFALNGILQLSEAITAEKRPYVYPDFKGLMQIEVVNNKINFDIPISSLWAQAKDLKVTIKSLDSNIKFSKSKVSFKSIKSSNKNNINFDGKVRNLNKTSRVDFLVSISYKSQGGEKFSQDFKLSTELYLNLNKAKQQIMPIGFTPEVQKIIEEFLSGNRNSFDAGRRLTQRVMPTGMTSGATEYYVSQRGEEDGVEGIVAYVLKQEGNKFVQKKAAFLAGGSRYQIFKLDFLPNHPGKEYIVRSDVDIADKEGNISDKYLEFHIINEKLDKTLNVFRLKPRKSILGRAHIDVIKNYYFDITINGLINPNLNSFYEDTAKIYRAMSSHPRVLTNDKTNFNDLFFMAEGFISDLDNNLSINNFSQEDYLSLQIYYMEKVSGSDELQLRTFSTPEMKQKVKLKFAESFYDKGIITSKVIHPDMQLKFWKMLENNNDNSEVSILASFAKEAQASVRGTVQKVQGVSTNHFFIINVFRDSSGEMNFDVLPFNDDIGTGLSFDSRKDDILTYFALDEMSRGTLIGVKNSNFRSAENTFVGISNRSKFNSERDLRIESQKNDEYLNANGNLVSYKNGEMYYSLFRTSGELLLTSDDGDGVTFNSKEMKVTQFLPGIDFEEVIVPSFFKGSTGLTPAIFVNASEIYSRRVYSWVVDSDKKTLISPINLNIELPKDCYTLLPSKLSSSASMQYTFICKRNNSWEYRFVSMEKN